MAGSSGTREIAKRYPVEEGLTAGTTKQVGDNHLIAQEKSLLRHSEKALID